VRPVRFAGRLWYYFRIGYSTYLTWVFGYVSTLITVYYLAIKNLPDLLALFPHFQPFAILATLIGAPLAIGVGWVHLKRTPAYSSEVDITTEANPYNYKLPPGYTKEVYAPLNLQTIVWLRRLLESKGLIDEQEKAYVQKLEDQMKALIEGGMVGNPRSKALQSTRRG